MEFRFVPIQDWPGNKTHPSMRKYNPFQSGWDDTLNKMKYELDKLNAKDVIIQLYTTNDQIRMDGWPRSNCRVSEPGVILTFTGKHGTVSMPCDSCKQWKDNIRAIALTLQRLRLADLYGVTKNGEQYKGWAKLDPPKKRNKEWAKQVLSDIVGIDGHTIFSSGFEHLIKKAKVLSHPDKPGGSHDKFLDVLEAEKILLDDR